MNERSDRDEASVLPERHPGARADEGLNCPAVAIRGTDEL
jgi:hypothetical protein